MGLIFERICILFHLQLHVNIYIGELYNYIIVKSTKMEQNGENIDKDKSRI